MHKLPYLSIFSISLLLNFLLLFSLPILCLSQPPAEDRVNNLYQQYRNLRKQGRYKEAIKYGVELVDIHERIIKINNRVLGEKNGNLQKD